VRPPGLLGLATLVPVDAHDLGDVFVHHGAHTPLVRADLHRFHVLAALDGLRHGQADRLVLEGLAGLVEDEVLGVVIGQCSE
jgi:hypothetical protein